MVTGLPEDVIGTSLVVVPVIGGAGAVVSPVVDPERERLGAGRPLRVADPESDWPCNVVGGTFEPETVVPEDTAPVE
jgi:hypothetical protein